MNRDSRIYVAGHQGLVGSALVRKLQAAGFSRLLLKTKAELDLTVANDVFSFFADARPEYVFLAAAKVGGIAANTAAPADFLLENLKIQTNTIEACFRFGVHKTLFLGSACMYPRDAAQPVSERSLLTGPLEPTNEAYAIAKIAGVTLAREMHRQFGLSVICPVPCNVYGPGDHFAFERSHVISALVRRFAEARASGARAVNIWGTGRARREFLHVDDLADACLFLMGSHREPDPINVGSGEAYSIREVAEVIASTAGFDGTIEWDTSKPDGMPSKLLDSSKLHALGWRHRIPFGDGIQTVLRDFRSRF
jgi:GDP-L-fucose synthase